MTTQGEMRTCWRCGRAGPVARDFYVRGAPPDRKRVTYDRTCKSCRMKRVRAALLRKRGDKAVSAVTRDENAVLEEAYARLRRNREEACG